MRSILLKVRRMGAQLRGAERDNPDILIPCKPEDIAAIPEQDMIHAAYDIEDQCTPKQLLLVLSTQRSGSTLFCEQLSALCYAHPHEYFQSFQYMQILNARWAFSDNGRINWERLSQALRDHRTSRYGVVAINLHGSHLRRFMRAQRYFADLDVRYVYVTRRDLMAQALSLVEATQTKQWSTHYMARGEARYDYPSSRAAIASICEQNVRIQAYLAIYASQSPTYHVVYEDHIANPAKMLCEVTGLPAAHIVQVLEQKHESMISKQYDSGERALRLQQFAGDSLNDARSWIP